METCGAYNLQPVTQYRWQLLKSSDEDWTFLKDQAIQNGGALRDILPCSIGLTLEMGRLTDILLPPMEQMKMVFTRLVKKEVGHLSQEKCEGCMA